MLDQNCNPATHWLTSIKCRATSRWKPAWLKKSAVPMSPPLSLHAMHGYVQHQAIIIVPPKEEEKKEDFAFNLKFSKSEEGYNTSWSNTPTCATLSGLLLYRKKKIKGKPHGTIVYVWSQPIWGRTWRTIKFCINVGNWRETNSYLRKHM